jgi:4'-phosphopantetheinyl transferase
MRSVTTVEVREFDDATICDTTICDARICNATIYDATELASDVVHVWKRSLQAEPAAIKFYSAWLSDDEHERAARYRVEQPRTDFILTRGTLRVLIASYLRMAPQEIKFRYSKFGKPSLEGNRELRFNVSHTNGRALLAFVKDRELGVDVEHVRTTLDARELAERFFSEAERSALEKLTGDDLYAAFYRCWTRKEAYIKAKGEGLSLPLTQFDVSVAADELQALLATRPEPSEASRWMLRDLNAGPGYAAALAVAG